MKLNKRIEALLLDHGKNMSDLARFCGVTPQAVQQWIEGVTTPRGKRLASIADFFGMPEADLVYGGQAKPVASSRSRSGKGTSRVSAEEMYAAFEQLDAAQKSAIVAMLRTWGVLK